jgi:hypothetical protein
MASLAMAVVEEAVKQLPLHKAISGIFGSISMAAWICVIVSVLPLLAPKKHPVLTATLAAASNDCQLPSEERRRAEHAVPGCLDDWRRYKLNRCVRSTCAAIFPCRIPILLRSAKILCCFYFSRGDAVSGANSHIRWTLDEFGADSGCIGHVLLRRRLPPHLAMPILQHN